MREYIRRFRQLLFLFLVTVAWAITVQGQTLDGGDWKVIYKSDSKTLDYAYKGAVVLRDVFSRVKLGDDLLDTKDCSFMGIRSENITDGFGNGRKYLIEYRSSKGLRIEQQFYFYPGVKYFLSEVLVKSEKSVSSNYLAPLITETRHSLPDGENRMLLVPFDNDKWVRYESRTLNGSVLSYEVSAIFDGKSRMGLIIGSVEHDVWKTGVEITATEGANIDSIKCFGGVASELTRDVIPHGSIKGTSLKSPRIFVGMFEDWRMGMDAYGSANAIIAPPRKWEKGTPFGWNSWGVMQAKLNYEGAIDVANFIKTELQPKGFENDATVYVDLDSFWDNFSDEQLKDFAQYCKRNGQVPGIYWSPFADWGKNPERRVEGTQVKYKDVYLYANGKPQDLDGAYAIDPTHPAVKKRIDRVAERFRKAGFEYVKLDFLTHGALEADSHADKRVATGIQAYNEGMKYLVEKMGKDMYFALSIAPSFPAQYGHSKRISCDVWGKIADTEYVMNSLSFGWWLNEVYCYNDPDHVVLHGFSEGENRARVTSAVITGMFLLGDNFSQKGSFVGDMKARELAMKFATNPEINAIAKIGRSFRPVEGYLAGGHNAESMFVHETKNFVYLAVFNYGENAKNVDVSVSRLGLVAEKDYKVRELWSGEESVIKGSLQANIPPCDARVYKIEK